ncbi:hypothetical protein N7454_006302 [Penicillium verhagenii]|nr:hypothetical protein N7454_006302 [Penicillium verhagenii]
MNPSKPYQEIEDIVVIPQLGYGTDHEPPGGWATRIQSVPWSKGRKGDYLRSLHLVKLSAMSTLREPLLRETRSTWLAGVLERKISSCIQNIESAFIQIKGEVVHTECTSCAKQHGPWGRCIALPVAGNTLDDDSEVLLMACGNCHWKNQDARCDFDDRKLFQVTVSSSTNRHTYKLGSLPEDTPLGSETRQKASIAA